MSNTDPNYINYITDTYQDASENKTEGGNINAAKGEVNVGSVSES
jgi:hypothetical protein